MTTTNHTIPIIQQPDDYVRGVSFDTMTDQDQPDYSFTLRGKNQGYQRTRRSRTFMVATDLANYSDYALDWAIEVCFFLKKKRGNTCFNKYTNQ